MIHFPTAPTPALNKKVTKVHSNPGKMRSIMARARYIKLYSGAIKRYE